MEYNDKYYRLCEAYMANPKLTPSVLTASKLTNEEIAVFLKKGLLIAEEGEYRFTSADLLYQYGMKAKHIYFNHSLAIFNAALNIQSDFFPAAWQLMLYSIKRYNFDEAFKYFHMYNKSRQNKKIDYRWFGLLILFNELVNLPSEYQEALKNIQREDLINDELPKEEQELSEALLNRDFILAQSIIEKNPKLTYASIYIFFLRIIQKNAELKMIEENRHQEFQMRLERKIAILQNTKREKSQLSVCKLIISLQEKGTINPLDVNTGNSYLDELIIKGRFTAAKEYEETILTGKEKPFKSSLNYLLLEQLEVASKRTISIPEESDLEGIMHNITSLLKNGKTPEAMILIHNILTNCHQEKYEYLITSLIKLNILKKDYRFTRPLTLLEIILTGNYQFNKESYIMSFKEAIRNKLLKEARIYYEIIYHELKNTSDSKLLIPLKEELDALELAIQNESLDTLALAKTINQELITSACAIIENQDPSTLKALEEHFRRDYDYNSFYLTTNPPKLVIKKKTIINDSVYSLIKKAKEAYSSGLYAEALEYFLKIFYHFDNPLAYTSSMIGLCLIKLDRKEEALKYLEIATYTKDSNYDYLSLITSIKSELRI